MLPHEEGETMKAKHVLAGAVAALALTLTNVGIAAANEKQPDTSPSILNLLAIAFIRW